MNLIDIKMAIAEKIKSVGGSVIASEVKEGFEKPAYFVEVLPIEIEPQNYFYELITVNVEIRFIPLIETSEECITTLQNLKKLFADPINIGDRYLNAEGLMFDMDASALLLNFTISFMQNTEVTINEYEKMKDINLREEVKTYGTATNSN